MNTYIYIALIRVLMGAIQLPSLTSRGLFMF